MSLSIADYQRRVDDWIRTFGVRYFSELTNLAQLVEEIGEVARIMARRYGDQSAKPGETPGDLADELADVLFVVACIANQTGIDLTGAVRRNMDKKTRRDKDRHRRNAKLDPDRTPCPVCGEMLRGTWTICPSCETPQGEPACPGCGFPVKKNWKRCPECRTVLTPGPVAAGGAESPERNASALDNAEVIGTPIDPATGMEFIRVPAGSFQMGDVTGDGAANEQPVHAVTLDEFFIGKFPVTQGQWTAVMSENPSKFQRGDDYPAEQVTWEDVEAFIRRLNEMNAGKFSFSLPSEAQWEYAARSGGKEEEYAGGNDLDALGWFQENSGGATHPVGKKAPNGLGIYDMSGNVWEWCADTFQENAYKSHASANPVCRGPGPERALRGGSWHLDAWSARCARRFGFPTDYKGAGLGFRLVCKRT